jgi:hypothetical protein
MTLGSAAAPLPPLPRLPRWRQERPRAPGVIVIEVKQREVDWRSKRTNRKVQPNEERRSLHDGRHGARIKHLNGAT